MTFGADNEVTPDVSGWMIIAATADSSLTAAPIVRICSTVSHSVVMAEGVGPLVPNGAYHVAMPVKVGQTYYPIAYRGALASARVYY